MRNSPLSDKQKQQIYDAHCMGQKPEDIAQQFGIARSTTYRVISEQRRVQESKREDAEVASKTKTIAGDKTNGRLTTTVDMHRFEGSCVINGKKKSKTFVATGAKHAKEQWEKWCKELRDRESFMDMVERKPEPPAPAQPLEEIHPIQAVELPVEPEPVPSDERIREAIHEAQEEFDAITNKHMEATGVPLADTSEPAYLIWAKRPEPKVYRLYLTMEDALAEVDRLNDVAAFLGQDSAFEVEEVSWAV